MINILPLILLIAVSFTPKFNDLHDPLTPTVTVRSGRPFWKNLK